MFPEVGDLAMTTQTTSSIQSTSTEYVNVRRYSHTDTVRLHILKPAACHSQTEDTASNRKTQKMAPNHTVPSSAHVTCLLCLV